MDAGSPSAAAPATAAAGGGSSSSEATTLAFEDSGKPVTLKVGARLVVKLRANGGTGFEWEVSKDDPKVLAPDGEPKGDRMDDAQVGGRVMMSFPFVGKAPGTTRLEIILHRSWETKPPLQTFAIDVTVK
jgi:predicted secreted protein